MARNNQWETVTLFAIGAAMAAGLALLLWPEPSPGKRVRKALKPYRKELRKSLRRTKDAWNESAHATARFGRELGRAGRDAWGEWQDDVAEVLQKAREELNHAVEEQLSVLAKRLRKARKKVGG